VKRRSRIGGSKAAICGALVAIAFAAQTLAATGPFKIDYKNIARLSDVVSFDLHVTNYSGRVLSNIYITARNFQYSVTIGQLAAGEIAVLKGVQVINPEDKEPPLMVWNISYTEADGSKRVENVSK